MHWRIGEVLPGHSFVIEMQLDRATLRSEWRLEALAEHKTRMTQRLVLSGSNAEAYARQVETGFGPTLADGLNRIASDMAIAERLDKAAG